MRATPATPDQVQPRRTVRRTYQYVWFELRAGAKQRSGLLGKRIPFPTLLPEAFFLLKVG